MIVNGQRILFAPAGTKVKVGGETQPEFNADEKADVTYVDDQLETKLNVSYLLDLFPVGTIITKDVNVSPASYIGGKWETLPEGYSLWTTTTDGEGGQTIEAGLPNLQGSFACSGMSIGTQGYTATGVFYSVTNGYQGSDGYGSNSTGIGFDASRSNSIYGNSNTVQPPAYKIYAWRRYE